MEKKNQVGENFPAQANGRDQRTAGPSADRWPHRWQGQWLNSKSLKFYAKSLDPSGCTNGRWCPNGPLDLPLVVPVA